MKLATFAWWVLGAVAAVVATPQAAVGQPAGAGAAPEGRIYNVMLLDGQNNHNWKATTPAIRDALESTGRFKVTVVTAPPANAAKEDWERFKPEYTKFDAVVNNFTDWGVKNPTYGAWADDLFKYVAGGGAYVAIHAASFEQHPEHAKLKGMGWRDPKNGDRLYVDDAGKTVRQPVGEGRGTSHGRPFEWKVTFWPVDHPICAGLPKTWPHLTDELWEAARGPAQSVEVIATAVGQATKQNEPVMWTVQYGKGRAFITLLGHDAGAMKCVGFRRTLARGCEWAITGKVTMPVPGDFPGK